MRCCLVLALIAGLWGCTSFAENRAEFLQSFAWTMNDPAFGGLSGLVLDGAGAEFVAISDRGRLLRGTIARDDRQKITAITADIAPLPGAVVRGADRYTADAEGLGGTPDRFAVSFEGLPRVNLHAGDSPVRRLPSPEGFSDFPMNGGLESAAIHPDGTIYVLPERSGRITRPFPVWRYRDGRWDQPFDVSRSEGFLPVEADIGPDGRFYLLERGFNGFGFRSRVRAFDLTETGLENEATLFSTRTRTHDNLEGLSVWRDADGHLRLTMVSDDNFAPVQRTEIVEYLIPGTLASSGRTP